ncbi:hypothetical protein [Mariniblastus fucicola]|uniref:Uncharacterized protein n=1 Tax=Mariniblastus fucicola TaxID=980251 RepID=A0A5B9PHQ4_9BACT|nr:hypothetical protein [Mariniblastus fucicola]QEG24186.1 hypothetical protein MFFC18_41030 [Mariniblastus fucicola]
MDASITYGFLEVLSDDNLGYTGGLLLVNQDGKPTEFHCTAPVTENRTQKILYGKTYHNHIFCDLIGAALVKKCSASPELLFIEQRQLKQLAGEIAAPVLMVEPAESDSVLEVMTVQYPEFRIDHLNVSVLTTDLEQFEFVKEACDRFTTTLTLDEPFERIRQAIGEAQNVARQSDAA